MGTRQDIKEDENWIRKLIKADKTDKSAASRAWNRMIDYYGMKDFLEGNHHLEIIIYIYKTNHYKNETLYRSSSNNYVCERTLYRYRKKYILCFKRYYEEEKEKDKYVKN